MPSKISEYCCIMGMSRFGSFTCPFDTKSFSFLTASVWLMSTPPLLCFSFSMVRSWRIFCVLIMDISRFLTMSVFCTLAICSLVLMSVSVKRRYNSTTLLAAFVSWSATLSQSWADTVKMCFVIFFSCD